MTSGVERVAVGAKPCGECGSKNLVVRRPPQMGWYVACPCGNTLPTMHANPDQAVAAWNEAAAK